MYVDAITASPFLGVGSLAPMFDGRTDTAAAFSCSR